MKATLARAVITRSVVGFHGNSIKGRRRLLAETPISNETRPTLVGFGDMWIKGY